MGLNLIWLGFIWGTAVGILTADVLYFLSDSLLAFLSVILFSIAGYYLGLRAHRRNESRRDRLR
jgi:ABC-type dipeptide/oligopeptide/nickel transport system permease component